MPKSWRLLIDREPGRGSWNMAVDDYLFQSLERESGTCLRFYSWIRPTVSLGYSQDPARVLDVEGCRSRGIDVVRRITGGKLVLHDREVTYALCSDDTELFSDNLTESYRRISQGLMRGLECMGLDPRLAGSPPSAYARSDLPCFSYPARDEIEVRARKIVGSAQKRKGPCFLQHGSIPLLPDDGKLRRILPQQEQRERIRSISLSEALGRTIDFFGAVTQLSRGLAEFFGVTLQPWNLSPPIRREITRLEKRRHADPEWIAGTLRM